MAKSTPLYVGLDVHKESIAVAHAAGGRAAPPVFVGEIGARQADLEKLIRRLQGKAPELRFVYETGPCGYGLYRYLTGKGVACDVVAPSPIPRQRGVRRPRALGVLQWVIASAGRHHQSGQRPRAPRLGRSRLGLSHPAKVSLHIQQRIDQLPKALQDLGWKAQVRLCKRYRRLVARGKHPNAVVTAIARELIAFMWAITRAMPTRA
jgi:hypothetical protein